MATGLSKHRKKPQVLATNSTPKTQAQLVAEASVFPSPSSSDDSSWSRSPAHSGSAIVGYVKIDDKVRISLGSVSSASEFRKLKRRLVGELERVKKLRRKIEGSGGEQCGGCEGRNYGNGEKVSSGGGGSKPCRSVARVNSEVSCVGPTSGRVGQMAGLVADVGGENDGADKGRKNAKGAPSLKDIDPVSGKKTKAVGGGEQVPGYNSSMTKFPASVVKKCGELLAKLMRHQYGWVFNAPVDAKKLKLHDYYTIIRNPMDLGTVKTRLTKNWYKSPKQFAEDVRLTFTNAMTYNEKGQDVHYMADLLLKLFDNLWSELQQELKDASPPAQLSKKTHPAAPVSKRPLVPPDAAAMEKKILNRQEAMPESNDMRSKGTKVLDDKSNPKLLKKHQQKDLPKRSMTFAEKQQLSTNLQFLPSDQLDTVVQIIRKRNPSLFQLENEIEVDIDCFDSETLWELDQFVNSYMKSVKLNAAAQQAETVNENMQESYLTSGDGNVENKTGKGKVDVAFQNAENKDGFRMSSSNVSNSSNGISGSLSKDSDSDSSSAESDGGR